MTIEKQTTTMLELSFDGVATRINLFRAIGIISPIIGVVILVFRQDIIGLFLFLLCVLQLYSLFTSITERCIFDKESDTVTFLKARAFGRIMRAYELHELEAIDIVKDSGWRYMCFYFKSNKREETVPSKQEEMLEYAVRQIQTFLSQ